MSERKSIDFQTYKADRTGSTVNPVLPMRKGIQDGKSQLTVGVVPIAGILRSLAVHLKSEMGEKPICIRTMLIKNKSSVCFKELEGSLDN